MASQALGHEETVSFDNPEWAAGFISGMVYTRHLIQTLGDRMGPMLPVNKMLESLDGALGVLEKAKPTEAHETAPPPKTGR